jgi:signal transduction histidine kinase/phage gp37-like protein
MTTSPDFLMKLLEIAAGSSKRSEICDLLREIALKFKADGAILWKETPWSKLEASEPQGRLVALGSWFVTPANWRLYDLPLESVTGAAVLDGYASLIVDISDPSVYKKDGSLRRAGITAFCAIPFRYSDNRRGALNLYFIQSELIKDEHAARLAEIAQVLPHLCNIVAANLRWNLTDSVQNILRDEDLRDAKNHIPAEQNWLGFQKATQALCNAIAAVFGAIEVSIFLENPLKSPGQYRLASTTWPANLPFRKKELRADGEEGLTGWVLSRGLPVLIFDLAEFPLRLKEYNEIYPGISWSDSLDITRSLAKLSRSSEPPPSTFMAAPILGSSPTLNEPRTLGAIRCCAARISPFYFGEMDVQLLAFVAGQIGAAWVTWLTRQQLREENTSWQRFVDRIADLNEFVESEISKVSPDERAVYQKALEVTTDVIARDVASDVRRLNEDKTSLQFYATQGAAWSEGTSDEVKSRLTRRFPVTEKPPTSSGAHVIQTGKCYSIPDTSSTEISYPPTFEFGRWLTTAPITAAGEILGVLDIRGTSKSTFPLQAAPIAALLAQQLGLYHSLLHTIAELRRQPLAQAQSYQDFSHQLRSPILQVHARAQESARLATSSSLISNELQKELLAVRGLAGKARSVSQSLRLFAELAQGGRVSLTRAPIDSSIIKLLIEMAEDSELISDPDRNLRFDVKREGFLELDKATMEVDKDLMMQAVASLLDNASKYSYAGTTIEIAGSITKTNRFKIAVKNTGIPIRGKAIVECRIRGWRSEEAEAVTGEGSGLGLWIVDNIMTSHGGELIVEATNRKSETEALLLFPLN